MAEYSDADIRAAKQRVEDMRQRAHHLTKAAFQPDASSSIVDETQKETPRTAPQETAASMNHQNIFDVFHHLSNHEDSGLILALILILSREKADNMLILALLYILL